MDRFSESVCSFTYLFIIESHVTGRQMYSKNSENSSGFSVTVVIFQLVLVTVV